MHPTERQLIDFALTEASEGARERMERHLAEPCARCAEAVAQYRELFEVMQTDHAAEPPAAWVERAVALGRSSWLDKVREWCGDLREEVGRLVFDSFQAPGLAPAGVRNVETERRMRFESGNVELDVRVEPVGRGGVITGQLLVLGDDPEPLGGARYLITVGATESVTGTTDDFGEFTEELPDLAALRIRVVTGKRLAAFEIPGAGTPED